MFSESDLHLLANRGKLLTKDQLTNGLKTNETLHRAIIKEYNNPSKHNLQNCNGNPKMLASPLATIDTIKRNIKEPHLRV